jgi:hypothetical protein
MTDYYSNIKHLKIKITIDSNTLKFPLTAFPPWLNNIESLVINLPNIGTKE